MFELLRRKAIASEIIKQYNKSERQLNVNELGRMLDFNAIADAEDAGINVRRVKDPMEQHAWVNTAVDFRARNLARCDFKIMSGETEVTQGPEFELFRDVNPYMSKYELWEATETWRMIRGEAIWVLTGKDQSRLGAADIPAEIQVADPNRFKVVLDKKETRIMRWVFIIDEATQQGIPFSNREIIQFKFYNKWNKWRGVNYWIAQLESIEQDVEANISNTQLIKNKSIPPGILSSEQVITADAANEMAERWEKQHKGAAKTGKIGIIGRGAKYQPISMSHADMQYMEMKKWNRITILAKAGVPPVLVSVKDESTPMSGTDTKEQQMIFWNQTMLPEKKAIEDKLRTDFFDRFGLSTTGEFDTENISELQEDYDKKVDKASKLFAIGIPLNDINEKLELGFSEYEWGDVGFRPMSMKPMTAEDGEPQEPPIPPPIPPADDDEEPVPFMPRADKQPRWILGYVLDSKNRWENLEGRYRSALKKWLYSQRKYFLDKYGKSKEQKTYEEFLFWAEQEEALRNFSETYFYLGMAEAGKDITVIFAKVGFGGEFHFYSGVEDRIVNTRLDMIKGLSDTTKNVIDTTIREGARQGFSQEEMVNALQKDFVKLGNHAETIARTELGSIKSTAQAEAYAQESIDRIMWIHTGRSEVPRDDHVALDGQIRLYLQEQFETDWGGLMYPRDINGAPGDVINCTCEFVPVPKGE